MTPPALVFFDSSVLIAATLSPSGGSAVSLEVCTGTRFRAAISSMVVEEALRNLRRKFGDSEIVRFYELLANVEPEMFDPPSGALLDRCADLTGPGDAHVLASALDGSADYLLSLDRRHLLNDRVADAGLPLVVSTPGDFINRAVRG